MDLRAANEILIDSRPLSPWRLLPDLFRYRDLLFVIAQREIQVRYSQTVLGVAWALIQPLGSMLLAWAVFGKIAKLHTSDVPYPLFCLIGTQIWTYFSGGFANASQSIISHTNIIGKIYFPRIILPLGVVLAAGMDLLISLTFLGLCLLWFGYYPEPIFILAMPLLLVGLLILTSGAGILGAALCSRYRDLRHAIPFLIQMGFFVTPIVYSTSIIPDRYQELFQLNPLCGYIDTMRAIAFHTPLPWESLVTALCTSLVIWVIGVFLFQKIEHTMADAL